MPLPNTPMSVAVVRIDGFSSPAPAATHTPDGTMPLPPTTVRSAVPSPVRSPSADGAAGAAVNGSSSASAAKLLPADALVTLIRLTVRIGIALNVALPELSAATVTIGPPLIWYWYEAGTVVSPAFLV